VTAVEPSRAHREVRVGSSRAFGFVFAAVFVVLAFGPLLKGHPVRLWALPVAAAFGLVAVAAPGLLRPLNLLWFRFGLLLHAVINPVVMSLIYWVSVVPVGLIMRAVGKDPLRLRRDAAAASYWVRREPPGPGSGTMSKQF
jgi:hypothetical protein